MIKEFLMFSFSTGYAKIRAISISKIRNNNEIKKNWKEKGIFIFVIKSIPHSNWSLLFFVKREFFFTIIMITKNKIVRRVIIKIIMFILIFFLSFWPGKLNVLSTYKNMPPINISFCIKIIKQRQRNVNIRQRTRSRLCEQEN